MVLEAYEKTSDRITGYKIYDCGTQVATLEFRNQTWIAGVLNELKIETKSNSDFRLAYEWIKQQIDDSSMRIA